jgi:hypothetical protein
MKIRGVRQRIRFPTFKKISPNTVSQLKQHPAAVRRTGSEYHRFDALRSFMVFLYTNEGYFSSIYLPTNLLKALASFRISCASVSVATNA